MNSSLTVGIWADNTIGGTEKAAALFAVGLSERGHRAIFLGPPGPRDQALAEGNVTRLQPPAEPAGLAAFLKEQEIEVIHQHVTGYEDSTLVVDALQLMGETRPRLIETNVFGGDPACGNGVDYRCYVSRTNAVQSFQRCRRSMNAEALDKCTVTFNPLLPLDETLLGKSQRDEARAELGVNAGEVLLIRFGREGGKWCEDEVEAFQIARRRDPRLRLLLMEPAKAIWRDVEAGKWGEGIILRRATSDFKKLAAFYSAGDLMLHMSVFGESYGYTIAEAMQHRLPVIVKSTPWRDNAQVELVRHGETGFVCASPEGAAAAVLELAGDATLRAKMGIAGERRIERLSSLTMETELVEEIMRHLVREEPLQKVIERNRDLLQFQRQFSQREKSVWELDSLARGFTYLQGIWYLIYRTFRNKLFEFKSVLRRS